MEEILGRCQDQQEPCEEEKAHPSVLPPLPRVSVVVDAQMNIARLLVGPADYQDHLCWD